MPCSVSTTRRPDLLSDGHRTLAPTPNLQLSAFSSTCFSLAFLLSLAASTELLFVTLPGLGRLHFYYVPFLVVAIFYVNLRERLGRHHLLMTLLLGSLAITAVLSQEPVRSLAFVGRTGLVYGSIAIAFAGLSRRSYESAVAGVVWSMRFQIAAAAVMLVAGLQPASITGNGYLGQGRAHFFYYEPSYAAISWTFLIGWIALNLLGTLERGLFRPIVLFDIALLAVALLATKSAFLVAATFVAMTTTLLLIRAPLRTYLYFTGLAVTAGAVIAIFAISVDGLLPPSTADDLLFKTISGFAESNDKWEFLRERAGNRLPRLEAAASVVAEHPLIGIGPGNYLDYSHEIHLPGYTKERLDRTVHGFPPVAIYLEFAAESGLIGLTFWSLFLLYTVTTGRAAALLMVKSGRISREYAFTPVVAACSQLILLAGAGGPLRPYLWVNLGLCIGVTQYWRLAVFSADPRMIESELEPDGQPDPRSLSYGFSPAERATVGNKPPPHRPLDTPRQFGTVEDLQ